MNEGGQRISWGGALFSGAGGVAAWAIAMFVLPSLPDGLFLVAALFALPALIGGALAAWLLRG